MEGRKGVPFVLGRRFVSGLRAYEVFAFICTNYTIRGGDRGAWWVTRARQLKAGLGCLLISGWFCWFRINYRVKPMFAFNSCSRNWRVVTFVVNNRYIDLFLSFFFITFPWKRLEILNLRGIWSRRGENNKWESKINGMNVISKFSFLFYFLILVMVLSIIFIKRINDCTIFYRFLMFRQWDFCKKGIFLRMILKYFGERENFLTNQEFEGMNGKKKIMWIGIMELFENRDVNGIGRYFFFCFLFATWIII